MTPIAQNVTARLTKARTDLLLRHPFFGSLLFRLSLQPAPHIPVMATDGVTLFYNPSATARLKHEELVFVLAHEVMHPALQHHTRRGSRDPGLWNRACVSEDTRILMADGSERLITQVKPGSYVHSPFGPSRVLGVLHSGFQETIELYFHQQILRCTKDHQIITESGAINAQKLHRHSLRGWYQDVSRVRNIHSGKLPDHEYAGNVSSPKNFLRLDFGVPSETGIKSQTEDVERTPSQLSSAFDIYSNRMGLLGGFGRWRGNDHNRSTWQVLSMLCKHSQHVLAPLEASQRSRLWRDISQKYERQEVLASAYQRLPDGRCIEWDSSLFSHQEGVSPARAALHRHQANAETSGGTNARNDGDLAESQGAKPTGVLVREGRGDTEAVYDLITEHHLYFANGLFVHNCDYSINPLLVDAGLFPPAGILLEDRFRGMSAEQIYALLAQEEQESGGSGSESSCEAQPPAGSQEQTGPGSPESDRRPVPKTPGGFGQVLDAPNPDTPHTPATPDQLREQEREWRVAVQQAYQAARLAGKCPAGVDRALKSAEEASVDWREALRRCFSETLLVDYTWSRPNRRFLASGLYLPGPQKEGAGVLAIAVDCSGSIDSRALSLFAAEVASLVEENHPQRVHVLYFDTEVQRADTFEFGQPITLEPKGGGGTDFRPVFDYLQSQQIEPHAVVFLTDLCGAFPPLEPPWPVIWASTERRQAPFGATVYLGAA